jgi:hypothetical protein
MATIRQNRAGNWEAMVRRRGHHESATFDTRKEAERWAAGVEARLKAGEQLKPRRLKSGPLLKEAISAWKAEAQQRLSRKTLAECAKYESYLPARLACQRLGLFTRDQASALHAEFSARGPYLANRVIGWLRAVFRHASDRGAYTGDNPFGAVRKNREHSRERFLLPAKSTNLPARWPRSRRSGATIFCCCF